MTYGPRQMLRHLVALGAVGALALTGCASAAGTNGGGGEAAEFEIGYVGVDDDPGDPVDGGTLTFDSYSFPSSLDPIETRSAGSVGATELSAIYDVLMISDKKSGEYTPKLAESLEVDDDYTEYTLTLRDGVTFSDGTPVDADAVRWSIERYADSGFDLAAIFTSAVAAIDTPDERTVVFTMNHPWSRFPALLATGPGYIVAPSSEDGAAFTPIGAGAFTVDRFAVDEELRLAPRGDYYGGAPHLDRLSFVPSAGAQAQLENLLSGQTDMTFLLQDEQVIGEARAAGLPGYLDSLALGQVLQINVREGRAGTDPRIREAIALGLDRDAVDERAQDGLGTVDGKFISETSLWSTDTEPLGFDPERAAELVDAAKADGFDGRLELVTPIDSFSMASALAIQASLNAVGFDIAIEQMQSTADHTQRIFADHDFDLYRGAFSFIDDAPIIRTLSSMGTGQSNNAHGFTDAQTDALIDDLWTATDEDSTNAALDALQARMNETIPYVVLGSATVFSVWNDRVLGVQRNIDNSWLFDQAWVS